MKKIHSTFCNIKSVFILGIIMHTMSFVSITYYDLAGSLLSMVCGQNSVGETCISFTCNGSKLMSVVIVSK